MGAFHFSKFAVSARAFLPTSILHLINLLRVIAESQSIKVRESPLMGEKVRARLDMEIIFFRISCSLIVIYGFSH